jgi:hypothetical protein
MVEFPRYPTIDEVFEDWRWDGEKWVCTIPIGTVRFRYGLLQFWDGDDWDTIPIPSPELTVTTQIFDAPGAYTYYPPSGLTHAIVECWAAGGGGGGALTSGSASLAGAGAGGGQGAYVRSTLSATIIGPSQSLYVGAGGAGGSGTANVAAATGLIGEASRFGSPVGLLLLAAPGEGGAPYFADDVLIPVAGDGGLAENSIGQIRTGGIAGFPGFTVEGWNRAGGGVGWSIQGLGGGNSEDPRPIRNSTFAGENGGPSAGGNGGVVFGVSSPSRTIAGGRGGNGRVVVTEFRL